MTFQPRYGYSKVNTHFSSTKIAFLSPSPRFSHSYRIAFAAPQARLITRHLTIRFLSLTGLKVKTENRMQYEEYLEELRPLREELGVPLQEDMYPGQLIAHVLDREYGVGFGPDASRKKEEDERKKAEGQVQHPVTG